MDWPFSPEFVSVSATIGLLVMVAARILMDEGPRRSNMRDLRDSLKDCRERAQQHRERADMEEHMRREWERRARALGWAEDADA